MGDFYHEIKTAKSPLRAKEDWKQLKNEKPKTCGKCKSLNTVCIFSEADGCIIGWTIEEEYYCNDCNTFTLYIDEYDS